MALELDKYKDMLLQQISAKKISAKTAGEYLSCMERLIIELNGRDDCASIVVAITNLSAGTEQGSKYISALKKYERDVLGSPKSLLYGTALQNLRRQFKQKPIGRELNLNESTYIHKINAMRNKRLKLAYRLQLRSGLRIAEVAALKKDDILFNDDSNGITLKVREGKGGKSRDVNVIDDDYLYQNLKEFIEEFPGDTRIFYSAAYMKKRAVEYGLLTHDLRRLNSKQRYRKERRNGENRRTARRTVQKELGHTKPRITSAYLGTDWEDE